MSASSVARMVHIDGSQLSENYKEHLSNFHEWEQKDHCEKWIQFPNNLGEEAVAKRLGPDSYLESNWIMI